jgi:hypothetical protein
MAGPCVAGFMSSTRSVPPLSGATHPIIRMVELLPAPLGPRKPNASPRCTSKSMPSTAVNVAKRFVRPRAEMSASVTGSARAAAMLLVFGARTVSTLASAVDMVSGSPPHGGWQARR